MSWPADGPTTPMKDFPVPAPVTTHRSSGQVGGFSPTGRASPNTANASGSIPGDQACTRFRPHAMRRKAPTPAAVQKNIVVPTSRDRHGSHGTSAFAHEYVVHQLDSGEISCASETPALGRRAGFCTNCAGGTEGQAKQDGDSIPTRPPKGVEPAGMETITKMAQVCTRTIRHEE
jgi:hypothetical protein